MFVSDVMFGSFIYDFLVFYWIMRDDWMSGFNWVCWINLIIEFVNYFMIVDYGVGNFIMFWECLVDILIGFVIVLRG